MDTEHWVLGVPYSEVLLQIANMDTEHWVLGVPYSEVLPTLEGEHMACSRD